MKFTPFAPSLTFLGLSLALASSAFATTPVVTVSSPTNNSSDGSPVHYVASATSPQCSKGISAMRIYTAPYTSAYTVESDQINTDLTFQPGNYNTVVEAYDNCGGVGTTDVNITVQNSALAPPRFLYATDEANQRIWGYTVNPSTGSLTLNGQGAVSTGPANACCYPYLMASDQGGYRVYATAGNGANQEPVPERSRYILRENLFSSQRQASTCTRTRGLRGFAAPERAETATNERNCSGNHSER